MPSYALPSWLQTSPDDIANKFVSGLQIGAQLGEARNKLAQQAQQSAVENQVTQDKLASSAIEQAQQLKVQQAYNDQQLSLKAQQVEAVQAKVKNETMKAAAMFQAQQSYQKDLQAGLDMGLPQDEAVKASYMKNMLPVVGGAAGMSALKTNNRGGVPTATVLTDSAGRKHTLAQIPGSLSFNDLDRSGGGGASDWQAHHDITRSEKVGDDTRKAKIAYLMEQLKSADSEEKAKIQSNLDALLSPDEQPSSHSTAPPKSSTGANFRWNPKTQSIEDITEE